MTDKVYSKKSGDELVIRLYDSSDSISEITALLHLSYKRLADLGFRFMATHQDDSETERRLKKGTSYLAISKGKIISTISLYFKNEESYNSKWYRNEGVAHFGQFGVLPEYQKKGIGNFMMDIVENEATKLGAKEISLDTAEGAEHLIKFYEQREYRFIEYVQWEVTNYRSVIMSKEL